MKITPSSESPESTSRAPLLSLSSTELDLNLCPNGTWPRVVTISLIRTESPLGQLLPVNFNSERLALVAAIEMRHLGRDYETDIAGNSPVEAAKRGFLYIVEPSRQVTYSFSAPFDMLQYSVSKRSLDLFTDSEDLPRIGSFQTEPVADSVLYHLSHGILSALDRNRVLSKAFMEYFVLSFLTRMVERYGQRSSGAARQLGGLSPSNCRKIEEILRTRRDGRIGMAELAHECGLSIGHFSRVFRQTFGMPVHRYLLGKRIDRAKMLLLDRKQSLCDISKLTGFTDQATFTDTFSRAMGISPGRYRRQMSPGVQS